MKKLSECISFPRERPFENYPSFYSEDWQNGRSVGYNQAIKECKDAVDKMGLDVDKIWNIIKDYKGDKTNNSLAKEIADNLPKLLKEK